jgi:hypothetical protein
MLQVFVSLAFFQNDPQFSVNGTTKDLPKQLPNSYQFARIRLTISHRRTNCIWSLRPRLTAKQEIENLFRDKSYVGSWA